MQKTCSIFLVIASGLLGGCSPSTTGDHPPTHRLTVAVTYNGTPVEGAIVSFIADGGENSASGITDKAGKARLSTFAEADGVVVGDYKVTVRKAKTIETAIPGNEEGDVKVEHVEELPKKYISPVESGLRAQISDDGPREIAFDLTD